jgi:hypothetical protein
MSAHCPVSTTSTPKSASRSRTWQTTHTWQYTWRRAYTCDARVAFAALLFRSAFPLPHSAVKYSPSQSSPRGPCQTRPARRVLGKRGCARADCAARLCDLTPFAYLSGALSNHRCVVAASCRRVSPHSRTPAHTSLARAYTLLTAPRACTSSSASSSMCRTPLPPSFRAQLRGLARTNHTRLASCGAR